MNRISAKRIYEDSLLRGRSGPSIREARADAEAAERAVRRASMEFVA